MKTDLRELLARLETATHLPTLPHILLKLVQVCDSELSTTKDISQIIGSDPSLTTGLMRLISSSHYALPHRVTSVEQAVPHIDRNTIKNLAVSASVHQVFRQTGDPSAAHALKQFWRHSLMCASLAQLIAQKTFYPAPDEAFLSGLLHDIGKLVLWAAFSGTESAEDLLLASETRSGTTHHEAGAWMIRQWNLQSFVADAVRYHHEPVQRVIDALPLVKIVFVANALCSETAQETDAKFKTAEQVFGFTAPEVEELMSLAGKEVGRTAESFGIEFGPPGTVHQSVAEKDAEKQQELVRAVRQISLLQGTIQNVLVALVGKHGGVSSQDYLMQEFVIPVEKKTSLLAQSLSQGMPLDSFGRLGEADLSIADNQIIDLMKKEGMLCLPMTARKQPVGVIVLGVDEAQFTGLSGEINLLKIFADQAALALITVGARRTQATPAQSESLTTSSAAVRKVVHEVSNPLGIIKNYLKILGLKLAKDSPAQEEIKIINEEIDRVSGIVHGLSQVSQPEEQKTEPVDINILISDLVKISHDALLMQSGIKAHLNLGSSLPFVMTDKNGLKQVFLNLIKNAVEAMPEGGNIYVDTRMASDGLGTEMEEGIAGNQQYVETTIRDDGSGIPDVIKSRLFEPFVTSKKEGHAGLGLSISHDIIRELNGTMTCKSDETSGTTFRIVLPAET
ncbi:MAG: HDOD domain-containing protein [Deltaproteobacteria bacterium]|nr:HDOD domain-containing protein [Deltaproteobacteria bacterium]